VFRDHPVVLEPAFVGGRPVLRNPIAELPRYGIDENELRERAVAPSQNPPEAVPLKVSTATIQRVVQNLIK
jgi:hypothetical protein